jgi:hypothetical protein
MGMLSTCTNFNSRAYAAWHTLAASQAFSAPPCNHTIAATHKDGVPRVLQCNAAAPQVFKSIDTIQEVDVKLLWALVDAVAPDHKLRRATYVLQRLATLHGPCHVDIAQRHHQVT